MTIAPNKCDLLGHHVNGTVAGCRTHWRITIDWRNAPAIVLVTGSWTAESTVECAPVPRSVVPLGSAWQHDEGICHIVYRAERILTVFGVVAKCALAVGKTYDSRVHRPNRW